MKYVRHKEVFSNRADVTGAETFSCDNCDESLVFALRDSKGQVFSTDFSVILECLAFAVDRGHAPKLPAWWWYHMKSRYGVGYEYHGDIRTNTEGYAKYMQIPTEE